MTQSKSISAVQAIAVSMLITMILDSMLISVGAQFMSHRIDPSTQERTAQKLLQHILELELPLAVRPAAPKRDSRATNNMNGNGRELSSSSTGNTVVDSNNKQQENECNQYAGKFEGYNGYNCVCSRTRFGTIFCRRQQHPEKQLAARNDPAVSLMLNNFEKLIDQLESRPSAQMRRHQQQQQQQQQHTASAR